MEKTNTIENEIAIVINNQNKTIKSFEAEPSACGDCFMDVDTAMKLFRNTIRSKEHMPLAHNSKKPFDLKTE